VSTDGWNGYLGINKAGYTHDRRNQRAAKALGEDIDTLLPGVHRVASLAKRWLLSTHQGAVDTEHLTGYLDEFCFRFNRRRSRSRGLVFLRVLQLAVGHDPCATGRSSRTPRRRRSRRRRPAAGVTRPAWTVLAPDGLGVTLPPQRRWTSRLRWIALTLIIRFPS